MSSQMRSNSSYSITPLSSSLRAAEPGGCVSNPDQCAAPTSSRSALVVVEQVHGAVFVQPHVVDQCEKLLKVQGARVVVVAARERSQRGIREGRNGKARSSRRAKGRSDERASWVTHNIANASFGVSSLDGWKPRVLPECGSQASARSQRTGPGIRRGAMHESAAAPTHTAQP